VVQVALLSTVLLGMGALSLDLGAMYVAKTELQAAADAAALAAAGQLVQENGGDPLDAARAAADAIAQQNVVIGTHAGLGGNDVEFGRAAFDAMSGRFSFQPGVEPYDSVRVTIRRTEGSEGGALSMTFANIFGHATKGMWAKAAAVLLPRDIAVVIDLSGSMNDDSELRHVNSFQGETGEWRPGVAINLRDIWAAIDGPVPNRPYVPGPDGQTQYAGDTGPSVYEMNNWGTLIVPDVYDPATDAGLWYIRRYQSTSSSAISSSLAARGYNSTERNVLMNGSYDYNASVQWRNRVGVILGLARWQSGYANPAFPGGGNGNTTIGDSEVTWFAKPDWYTDSWTNYINYVASGSSQMAQAEPGMRYRFGLKSFVNYAMEYRPRHGQTDILWATPSQPLQAVKDAVNAMVGVIEALDSLDHISLEVFAQSVRHEVNLTDDLWSVPNKLYERQAAHYDNTTNIAGGLAQGINELLSSRGRPAAAKIIVLMSDGKPNTDEDGNYGGFTQGIRDQCLAQAQRAKDNQMRLYTISVGEDVDRELMQEMAAVANGQEFQAAGTPEEYTEELEAIFRTLGGKRPVALIE
jgi:hypothetical protein